MFRIRTFDLLMHLSHPELSTLSLVLPVLAEGLRDTFDAVILTSYGMTECMPISSPPQTYRLDPIGTSGKLLERLEDLSILMYSSNI